MAWGTLIVSSFKLVFLLLSEWLERNKEKREAKKAARKMVSEGLKEKDVSKITAGFNRANRL